ncbi:DNA repair protein RecN [Acidithiobacillus sp.]
MLLSLHIRDFTLIDQLSIEFGHGLTVLTGETGAGKSILVDAIALLLGDKGSADLIRHGAEQADLSAELLLTEGHPARAWLAEHELDADENCLLRRILQRNGRSRAFINGQVVTTALLRELGEFLVDILGQHAHQSLLRPERQLFLLDRFARLARPREESARAYQAWRSSVHHRDALEAAKTRRGEEEDWLRFQLDELEDADLQRGEWESLRQEQALLGAVEQLQQHVNGALEALYESDGAVVAQLAGAQRELASARQRDQRLAASEELVNSALIQVEEAAAALRHYVDSLQADPLRLETIANRLVLLQGLQRKHHCDADALLDRRDTLRAELALLGEAGAELDAAAAAVQARAAAYRRQAEALSAARQAHSAALAEAIAAQVRQLGMAHAQVELRLESAPAEEGHWRETGWDSAEIWIAANPGHPPQPLAKVASGGELSRIGLALQVILSSPERIDTLIFDEVDVGIGGAVAETVGRLLRQLGSRQQVLCVTHLPQVAAQGHHHLQVEKEVRGDATYSRVRPLSTAERLAEIARMLGGVTITDQVRNAAAEMLARAAAAGTPW